MNLTPTGIAGNAGVRRLPPKMPTGNYVTYKVASPLATHYRPATCAEADCEAYENGWSYRKADLDERLLYIVTHAGKRYREVEHQNETYLIFEPGQPCFQARMHRVSLERPEFYYAGRGDFRSFTTRKAQKFDRPEDWQDHFAHHQDRLNTLIQRG